MSYLESFQYSSPAPVIHESQLPFQLTNRFHELMAKIPRNECTGEPKETGVGDETRRCKD